MMADRKLDGGKPGNEGPIQPFKPLKTVLLRPDGRTRQAKLFKQYFSAFYKESEALGRTGAGYLALCRQAASLSTEQEALHAAMSRGERIDPNVLIRISNALSKILSTIGIVDVPPEPAKPDLNKIRNPETWRPN